MQRIFRELGLLEPKANGYIEIVTDQGSPAPGAPSDCVVSQMVLYLTAEGEKVAEAHRYLRLDGSVGASGKADPKRIWDEGKAYILCLPEPS